MAGDTSYHQSFGVIHHKAIKIKYIYMHVMADGAAQAAQALAWALFMQHA